MDLDNTLVRIDVDAFVERYTRLVAARLTPDDPARGWAVVAGASYAMLTERDARATNRDRFLAAAARELGESGDALWDRLEAVAGTVLPDFAAMAQALPHGREAVLEARQRGLAVAIATNPIYPRSVIVERMRWAGLGPDDVDLVACMEVCTDTKPHPAYFEGLAHALGLGVESCLMVGDDPDQDVPDRPSALRVHLLAPAAEPGQSGRLRSGPLADLWRVWADEVERTPATRRATAGG